MTAELASLLERSALDLDATRNVGDGPYERQTGVVVELDEAETDLREMLNENPSSIHPPIELRYDTQT